MNNNYVKLKNNTKERLNKHIYTKEQISALKCDFGRLINKGFVVFDFDTTSTTKIISQIVKEESLKCKILYTTRGIHLMFKTSLNTIPNLNHNFNWIGLECDIKGVGLQEDRKSCYQAIKVNGKERKEEYLNGATCDNDLDIAPIWLYHVPKKYESFDLSNFQEGARNDLFFNKLKNRAKKYGFSYEEYCEQATIINRYVLPEGLPNEELEHAIREEAWDTAETTNKENAKIYAIMAQDVITYWNCLFVNKDISFFNDNINRYDTRLVVLEGYLQNKYKNQNITTSNMEEVFKQMRIQLENNESLHRNRDEEYILCGTQLVSMLQDKVIANTREIYTDVYYPFSIMSISELEEYENKKKLGYKFLNDISCGNEIIKAAICECLGCMLAPVNNFEKIFIWYGSGANGKSVLIKVMQSIMGNLLTNANILKINERFALSKAYKGIANITDDLGITTIKETGLLKSIISGSTIEIERKNYDPISWTPTSQFVMACNNIPRIQDTTKGMIRRLAFIPFKMELEEVDIDMTAKLLGTSLKLSKDERNTNASRYIMTKAIFAYRKAYNNGHLTELQESTRLLELFKEENQDDVKSFYNFLLERENGENGLKDWLNKKPFYEVFEEFAKFLGYNSIAEIENMTQRAFLVNFNKLLPPDIKKKNIAKDGRTIKIYIID